MGLDLSGNGSSETMYDEGGSNTGELPAIKPEATAIFKFVLPTSVIMSVINHNNRDNRKIAAGK